MAEKNNSPGHLKKTQRPQKSSNQVFTASEVVDSTKQSCKLCAEFDNLDMVRCDSCEKWFHFACVEVTREIENATSWMCDECSSKVPMDQPSSKANDDNKSTKSSRVSKSRKSHSSSTAKRKQLALERVEEERLLREAREKEYLDQKYKTLAEVVITDSDESEEEDLALRENTRQYTHQWVEELDGLVKTTNVNVLNSTAVGGQDVLTSTESNAVSTSERGQYSFTAGFADFWQRYRDELNRAYLREPPSNITGERNQDFVQHSQSSNCAGRSLDGENSNSMPASIAVTTSRNINSAVATRPSILRTKDRRETTYSVFMNQLPIMNSSVDRVNSNSGHHNYLNVNSQARVGFVNQRVSANEINSAFSLPESQVQMLSIGQPTNSTQSFAHSTYNGQLHLDNSRHPPMFTSPNFESQCTSPVAVTDGNVFGNASYNDLENGTFVQVPQSSSSMNYQAYNQHFNGDPYVSEANSTQEPGQPVLISLNGNVPTSSVVISRPSAGHSSNTNGQRRPPVVNVSSASFRPQRTFTTLTNSRGSDGDVTMSARLEANQIAARQAMPKNLPRFDGTPKDWLTKSLKVYFETKKKKSETKKIIRNQISSGHRCYI